MQPFDEYAWIRRQVESELHFPLTDAMWQDLKKRGIILHVAAGNISLSDVEDEVLHLLSTYGSPIPVLDTPPAMLSEGGASASDVSPQEVVRSRIVADLIGRHIDVLAFRADGTFGLGGKLLKWVEVESWILSRYKEATVRLPQLVLDNVPIPPEYTDVLTTTHMVNDGMPELHVTMPPKQVHERARFLVLRYINPGKSKERQILIPWNADTLYYLHRLAQHLVQTAPWTEAQAVIFILTGIPPLIASMTSRFEYNATAELSRLYLTIDPELSPREVAEGYRKIRQRLTGTHRRSLTEKHTQLAYFAVTQLKSQPLSVRMAEWNKQHPEWSYSRASNFSRDMLQAQRRLLGVAVAGQRDSSAHTVPEAEEVAMIPLKDIEPFLKAFDEISWDWLARLGVFEERRTNARKRKKPNGRHEHP